MENKTPDINQECLKNNKISKEGRKKKINKRKTKETNKKKKKIWKRCIKVLGGITLLGFISVGSVSGYFYYQYKDDISKYIKQGYQKIEKIDENTFNSRHPSQILDKEGNILKEFKMLEYNYQTYDEINENIFKALVAVEDVRFYEHKGIDLKGLMRAFYSTLIKGRTQGGSTITQQLAKNIFLTMDQTVWRKLEEAVIAQELEKIYSKEEILEFYVNNVNYGNGCYSIESASKYYFNKETEDLSLAECAFLVGIPNNPSLYNPLRHMENALTRKNKILKDMFEAGMITEEEMNTEKEREIILDVQKVSLDNSLGNNYALNYAVQKATETLMKYNGFQFRYTFSSDEERTTYFELYNEAYAESREQLVSGGYQVQTSIDMNIQNKLQKIVDDYLEDYKKINETNGLYMKQGSATVVDNKTGNVIAIVGGRSEDGNTYNRAVLGARQPGSAIKPLVSYIPAFETGYVPEDKMQDKAITKGPNNWYSGYKGYVTLRYATEISINTIPYRLTSQIGTENAMHYLANMKFKYLTPSDYQYPIVAVGGFERGATTSEMASAYSTIARNGEFIEPTNVEKIIKIGNNEVIYKNNHTKTRIYDAGASYLMTDTLKGVISKEHGTGHRYALRNYKYQAGKSGTTNNANDYWFCGYTPYYAMSVWIGDDVPSAQSSDVSRLAGYIWRDMMETLHKDKKVIDFKKPDSVYKDNKGVLRIKLEDENALLKERKKAEEKRKLEEIKEQKSRLSDEEYRLVYGLSAEEENSREIVANNKINVLANYEFTNLNQIDEVNRILEDALSAINNVKRKSAYNSLIEKYNSYKQKFDEIRMYLREQERLEKERLEQERLEKERLEQERLEKERLEQERLEQERLEQERLEQEKLEQERLEQEKLEQEESKKEEQEIIKEENNSSQNDETTIIEELKQEGLTTEEDSTEENIEINEDSSIIEDNDENNLLTESES